MAYSSIRVLVGMVLLSQFEVGFSDDILLVTVERDRPREREHQHHKHHSGDPRKDYTDIMCIAAGKVRSQNEVARQRPSKLTSQLHTCMCMLRRIPRSGDPCQIGSSSKIYNTERVSTLACYLLL